MRTPKNRFVPVVAAFLLFVGCQEKQSSKQNEPVSQEKSKKPSTPAQTKQPGPYYIAYYEPDSVELEDISQYQVVSEETAITVLVNSCADFKADYLNYLLDSHGTISPDKVDRDFHLEAEHIGRLIIWKLVKNETNCLSELFASTEAFFNAGSYPAQEIFMVAVLDAMYKEGLKFGTSFYSGLDPYLTPKTMALWHRHIDHP